MKTDQAAPYYVHPYKFALPAECTQEQRTSVAGEVN